MYFNPLVLAARATLLLSVVLPTALGAPVENEIRAPVLAPRDDPFYQPPSGFESEQPGAVLRSRRIIATFFSLIPAPIEAYQLLYRTTSVNGSAIATVTTVFKPLFAKKDRFVTYNTAYDSSATQCSPSYGYRLGGNPEGSFTTTNGAEFLIVQLYLLSGYIVSSPDYEGPDAAFGPGYLTGHGVLDSMRAVKNFHSKLGLTENPKIVGAGYSGGGLATGWAAALQPTYAPDLNVKGWNAGGIPASLLATFDHIDKTVTSGFEAVAVAGLLKPSAYGTQLKPIFDAIITPAGQKVIDLGNSRCTVPNILAFPFQSLLDTKYQSLGAALFQEPTVAAILRDNTLGVKKAETPTAPVLMYHAEPDEIVPYAPAAALNKAWCDYGATVKFTKYAAGGHGTTVVLALADGLKFAADAFSGKISSGCTSQTKFDNKLDPFAFALNLEPIVVGLINWLVVMGEKDSNWLEGIKSGKPI